MGRQIPDGGVAAVLVEADGDRTIRRHGTVAAVVALDRLARFSDAFQMGVQAIHVVERHRFVVVRHQHGDASIGRRRGNDVRADDDRAVRHTELRRAVEAKWLPRHPIDER